MTQKVIANVKSYAPTEVLVEAIDDNFDENYASIAALEEVVTMTEYANNAAAVTGGLAVGEFYTTTGTVKVVTA